MLEKKNMASITFAIDTKGEYLICNRDEVLHEVGKFVGDMWSKSKKCENCSCCRGYYFVLDQLKGVNFGKSSREFWWRIYQSTNEYNFETVKH